MLGACDDFLPGVAALGEADAVQEIEVQHLRNESLARGEIYLRQAGSDVRETPVTFPFFWIGIAGESVLRQSLRSADDPVTAGIAMHARDTDFFGFGVT